MLFFLEIVTRNYYLITITDIRHTLRQKKEKKYMCVFQVSRSYLGFCPDPKHFIVKCEQNIGKYAGKRRKM